MADNVPILIYTNRIEKRVTFKTKSGYYLPLFTPKTIKMPGCKRKKINKNEFMKMCLIWKLLK